MYDENNVEKFYNVPLRSFFMLSSITPFLGTTKVNPRRVKPYYGKINARKSYLFIPVGTVACASKNYVSLTFYYN
jgi:hypothetical protein